MIQSAICDTQSKSRKGRKPISGRAMTPAERKQRQRQLERSSRLDLPRWKRLRLELWQLVQQRFIFANAAELANALEALASAITFSQVLTLKGDANGLGPIGVYVGNTTAPDSVRALFPELLDYRPDSFAESNCPGYQDCTLFELLSGSKDGSSQ